MNRQAFIVLALITLSGAFVLFFFDFGTLSIISACIGVWYLICAALPQSDSCGVAGGPIRIGGMSWELGDFVRHWLIVGKIGSGKTLAAIKTLMIGFHQSQPNAGGLVIDEKGDFAFMAQRILTSIGLPDKVMLIRVPPPDRREELPPLRMNLIGDPAISWADYAELVVTVANSQGQKAQESFFPTQARDRIYDAFIALEAAGLMPTLAGAYEFFKFEKWRVWTIEKITAKRNALQAKMAARKALLCEDDPSIEPLTSEVLSEQDTVFGDLFLKHDELVTILDTWREFFSKAQGESSGVKSQAENYLRPYATDGIDLTFSCGDPNATVPFSIVDTGVILAPTIPQAYGSSRRYIMAFLKILYYSHGMRRFDSLADGKPLGVPLVLWADEGHNTLLKSEDGISDINSLDKLRAAHCTVVMAMQDYASAIPPLGSQDLATVLFANLGNQMIFALNTETGRKIAADQIGEDELEERSQSFDQRSRRSTTVSKRKKHIVPTIFFRNLPKFRCVLIHCEGRWRKLTLPPLTDDGKHVEPWFFKTYLRSLIFRW